MSEIYDFTLKQEVLMEKGADVQGEVFHFQRTTNEKFLKCAAEILFELIGVMKENILLAKTDKDLNCIESKFDFARDYINELSNLQNNQGEQHA